MNGFINDTYTVIPQYKGSYPIRPITFSYFDPALKRYKTVSSDEIIIQVENGPVPNQPNKVKDDASNENSISLANDQFKYIKTSTKLISINRPVFFKTPCFGV